MAGNAGNAAGGRLVMAKVDALVALREPRPEAVGKILGLALQMGQRSERFTAEPADGPFRRAFLRYYKDSEAGILVLDGRLEAALVQSDLDLSKYGPLPLGEPNPNVQPEGIVSYGFKPGGPRKGVDVSFQFTSKTLRLYMITVEWAQLSQRAG